VPFASGSRRSLPGSITLVLLHRFVVSSCPAPLGIRNPSSPAADVSGLPDIRRCWAWKLGWLNGQARSVLARSPWAFYLLQISILIFSCAPFRYREDMKLN
jgi:hypothetical protein